MKTRGLAVCTIIASLLAAAGCATSPEDEARRKEMEADVDEILAYELDPAEVGEPRNCLSNNDFRSYRALGNRHLLFEGQQGRLWVNVLRGRCSGLDDDSVFIMMPSMPGRLCEFDRFNVVDRFESLSSARSAPVCVLGEFKPVTEAQVKEVEDRLEMR
jgi:hypothetical protein